MAWLMSGVHRRYIKLFLNSKVFKEEKMNIQIKRLSKVYPNGTNALNSIDLEISKGMIGLLGPNGAVKTTLMKILTGILKKTEGEVKIFGKNIEERKEEIRTFTGYLPQEYGLYENLNAIEFLDYIGLFYNIKDRKQRNERINYFLDKVNLDNVSSKKIKSYSGGMKRRLGIAQALLNNPKLIIVDEPTAGLDPEERIEFRKLLRDLLIEDEERIVILSTHIVNDITALCSEIAVLNKGNLVYRGNIVDLNHMAEGKVWELNTTQSKLKTLERHFKIIDSKVIDDDKIYVKFLSNQPPKGAISIKPELEASYVWLLRKDEISDDQ